MKKLTGGMLLGGMDGGLRQPLLLLSQKQRQGGTPRILALAGRRVFRFRAIYIHIGPRN